MMCHILLVFIAGVYPGNWQGKLNLSETGQIDR